MVGIQMMALNFQNIGLEMLMNTTLFDENGQCGYVLKPQALRDPAANINIFGETFHTMVLANRVEIRVISGQLISTLFVNKTSITTYVQVDFYGLPLEQMKDRYKTKTVANNGINPIYGSVKEPPFVFEKIRFPERSFLHIRLMTDRHEQVGHRLLPIHLLTNGYRHIILRNSLNKLAGPASIFVQIKVTYYTQASHKGT
uniref:phosphoinositide phospholipase C n=1 Tax=Syphacia muris TaxID=451379 RepID=A0A0N5AFK6_9BILA